MMLSFIFPNMLQLDICSGMAYILAFSLAYSLVSSQICLVSLSNIVFFWQSSWCTYPIVCFSSVLAFGLISFDISVLQPVISNKFWNDTWKLLLVSHDLCLTLSGTMSGISFILTYSLADYLAYMSVCFLTCVLSHVRTLFTLSYLPWCLGVSVYISFIWQSFRYGVQHVFCHAVYHMFWNIFWHIFSHMFWHTQYSDTCQSICSCGIYSGMHSVCCPWHGSFVPWLCFLFQAYRLTSCASKARPFKT